VLEERFRHFYFQGGRMSKKIRWAAFLIAMILSGVAKNEVLAGCITNRNSSMDCDSTGFNCYCAGRGDGCSACTNIGNGGGWSICYYDYHTGDMDCTYQN
jgi:hypothetical protein